MNRCDQWRSKITFLAILIASFYNGTAHAQSSVTLYGIADDALTYQSSQTTLGSTTNGRSATKLASGVWAGDRVGLSGVEPLGGGLNAFFTLESGFNVNTGAQQFSGAMFTRQAFVGFSAPQAGTISFGRQYTSYFQLLVPYSPSPLLSGFFGAHPGDIDDLDVDYRTNNSIVFTSPTVAGVAVGGSYALGGVPGSFNHGSTWSLAIQYKLGPFGIASGVQRVNNSTIGGGPYGADSTTITGTQSGVSALTNGYQTAAGQQRFAVLGAYKFTDKWDLSLSYSNVQYIPGINSAYHDLAIFDTLGAVLHYLPVPSLNLAVGYALTKATRSNAISHPATYNQVTLSESYSLSTRTTLFALEGLQRANGQTLGTRGAGAVIAATASIGDGFNGAPSSARSQIAVGLGISHKF